MVTSSTLFVTLTKKNVEGKAKEMPPPFPFLTCAAHSATNEFKITLKKTQECFKMEEDLIRAQSYLQEQAPLLENTSSDVAKVLIAIRTNENEFGAHTQDDLMKLGSKFNYIIYSNSFYDQVNKIIPFRSYKRKIGQNSRLLGGRSRNLFHHHSRSFQIYGLNMIAHSVVTARADLLSKINTKIEKFTAFLI